MKIAIIGLGRVAMADALALARTHEVVMTGPVPDRVEAINRGDYNLNDPALDAYLASHPLKLRAVLDTRTALADAQMVFVSTPIAQHADSGRASFIELDTRIELAASICPRAPIVLRSAVPVGYCDARRIALKGAKIVYAPEFSREGHRLSDLLHPRFLIVGDRHALGRQVLDVLKSAAMTQDIPSRQIGSSEAELTRHLSVLFQAARVSYFNELDSYALHHDLNARQIIDGICLDPRIGAQANNPCFGYRHQTLPLSLQMLGKTLDAETTPVIACLEKSHAARMDLLSEQIRAQRPAQVGIYLQHRSDSLPEDLALLRTRLETAGIATRIQTGETGTLDQFKSECEIVIAQRDTPVLADIRAKVFTRDHYAHA